MGDGFARTVRRTVGGLGAFVLTEWEVLHHAAAVIGTVLLVGFQLRYWARPVWQAFAWQISRIGVGSVVFVCGVAIFVGITVIVHVVSWIRAVGQSRMIGPILGETRFARTACATQHEA